MAANLRRLTAGAEDLQVLSGGTIVVRLDNGREHAVQIREDRDGLVLEAWVANQRQVRRLGDVDVYAWQLNRTARLVGFRCNERGQLVAHAWTPIDGLTSNLFCLTVRTLAAEADHRELLLTGQDRR